MRKIIYGIGFLFIALSITSCTKVASPDTFEFTLTSSDFSSVGTSGNSNYLYAASRSVSAITDNVVNYGAVLGYVKLGGTQWAPMPYLETYSTYISIYSYQYESGTVYFVRKDSDLLTVSPGSITVKIVVLTQKQMHLIDDVDIKNYQEVAEALSLEK